MTGESNQHNCYNTDSTSYFESFDEKNIPLVKQVNF